MQLTASAFESAAGIQASAAGNPATPQEWLAQLARSELESVRAAIATNPSSNDTILAELANDPSSLVRDCLLKRDTRLRSGFSIHPTALVSKKATLEEGVVIGAYSIIHDHVSIGARSYIGSHCEIGHPALGLAHDERPLSIGKDAFIRSHSVFYEGSTFGDNLTTGHRVVVREKTKAGSGFQIGTSSDVQGHCTVGDYVRFQSNIFVAQQTTIGDFVWAFPYTAFTNDPHPPSDITVGARIGNFVAIATGSVVLPGVQIGDGALVGANSTVVHDVAADTVVIGSPARFYCNTENILLKDGSGRPAYPWKKHFHRGYPGNIVQKWLSENRRINE